MANLTSVTLTAGVPTAGTGTVGTIDNVTGTAGTPSTAVLTVQGVASGTAQPVSGTVSAAQSGTWTVQPGNTANTTAWKVDGSAVTQPVSVATVPSHPVTNAGTFAVQNTAATPAGTNTIGAAKVTDGTNTAGVAPASTAPTTSQPALVVAISPNSVNANGQTTKSASAPVTLASDQPSIAVAMDTSQLMNGASGVALTPSKAKINISTATTTTLVALVSGKKIRVLSMYLVCAAADTITLQSHTTTSNSDGGCSYAANGGISLPFNPLGWFDTTAGEALDMVTSASGQVSGQITYVAV